MLAEVEKRCAAIERLDVLELQQLTGIAGKLQRAHAAIAKEARSIEKDAADAVADLSLDEQRALLVQLYLRLPLEHQAAFTAEVRTEH